MQGAATSEGSNLIPSALGTYIFAYIHISARIIRGKLEIKSSFRRLLQTYQAIYELPASFISLPRLSIAKSNSTAQYCVSKICLLVFFPTPLSFGLHFWRSLSPTGFDHIFSVTRGSSCRTFEREQPRFLSSEIYTMKSVLLWTIFAISQGSLVVSAPVGPTGPCPDVRASYLGYLKGNCWLFPVKGWCHPPRRHGSIRVLLLRQMQRRCCCLCWSLRPKPVRVCNAGPRWRPPWWHHRRVIQRKPRAWP
jgi:hypothetical protein